MSGLFARVERLGFTNDEYVHVDSLTYGQGGKERGSSGYVCPWRLNVKIKFRPHCLCLWRPVQSGCPESGHLGLAPHQKSRESRGFTSHRTVLASLVARETDTDSRQGLLV